jgi:hypothetical protein
MPEDMLSLTVVAIPVILAIALAYGFSRWRSRGPTKAERDLDRLNRKSFGAADRISRG